MNRRHRIRRLAVASLFLATAACGARWTDEQQAAVVARGAADGEAASSAGGVATASGSTPGAPAAAVGSPTAAGGSVGGPAGGAQSPASGPAEASGGAGPLPCAAPSDAPGVTDEQITIGSISSLSGPVPGLGTSSANATRAYVAYRNATGGVCGRQLVLREADDGTDIGRYRSVIGDLAPDVLGIAGGFAFGDVGSVDIIQQHGLPVVNIPSADSVTVAPTVFDMNPPFEDPNGVIGKYRYLYEQGARTVSLTYIAVDQSRSEANKQRALMEAAGIEVVQVQELPLSTLSYDSAARGVANSGADYLFFIADAHGNVSMATSMADTGYRPRFAEYFTFAYGTDFIESAGAASEGAVTWLRALPNEEAGTNAELAAFLSWMDQIASDDVRDPFAVDAWAGTKAFIDALEAIPGPITREALVAQLQATDTFDAGGMYGPIRLGAEVTNACEVAMQVVSGQWQRLAPAGGGFLC